MAALSSNLKDVVNAIVGQLIVGLCQDSVQRRHCTVIVRGALTYTNAFFTFVVSFPYVDYIELATVTESFEHEKVLTVNSAEEICPPGISVF